MASLTDLRAGFTLGVDEAAPLELQLRDAYLRELNRAVKEAAARFARSAITASAWQLPNPDEVLPDTQVHAKLLAATQPIRVKIVSKMMGTALAGVGVSFDVQNPLAQGVLGNLGKRITEITHFTRASIMASLGDSFDKGLSIPHAARAMAKTVNATNKTRATLIARTEFIGAQNGASLASVQYTGAAKFKTWLATDDGRTREDHADASGQTIPVSDPFDVGGFPMMYPGDQGAPAEEVCNCRCTMTYSDDDGSGGSPLAPDDPTTQGLDPSIMALYAKHPVGSTRAYYKNGNGYKLGLHKVLAHDTEAGTVTIESTDDQTIKTVAPHELKKPNKPKALGTTTAEKPHSPVTTSPLVDQAHAAPSPNAMKDLTAKINAQLARQIKVGDHVKAGISDKVYHVDEVNGDVATLTHPAGHQIEVETKHLTVTTEQPGIVVDKPYKVLVNGTPSIVSVDEVEGDVVTATITQSDDASYVGHQTQLSASKDFHPAGEESKPAQAKPETAPKPKKPVTNPTLAHSFEPGDTLQVSGQQVTVKSVTHDGNIVVETSKGGTYTVTPGDVEKVVTKASEPPPPTVVEHAAPKVDTSKPFTPQPGQLVHFDSGYDPDHPYKSPDAKPIDGGTGTVISVDYSSNQVMIQRPDGRFVQTHLSKMTNEHGQTAEWQAGGGKPSTAQTAYHQASPARQEFVPIPKPLGKVLSPQAFAKELNHDQTLLDDRAKSAVHQYTGSSYVSLNRSLRDTKGATVPRLGKDLDHAFEQIASTTKPGILHRYTQLRDVESAQNPQVGQVIHDDGFVSTSVIEGRTSGFGSDHIIIEVPKGSKVIDINAAASSGIPGEAELLINRGARMVITKIDDVGGRRTFHVRLLTGRYKPSPLNPNE